MKTFLPLPLLRTSFTQARQFDSNRVKAINSLTLTFLTNT
jgi:hypothetical protein